MGRIENIAVFEDSIALVEGSERLKEAVRKSRKSQLFIREKDSLPYGAKNPRFEGDAKIIVSKKRTFEAAQDYAGKGDRVCVLNFASASEPGGGVVSGAGAQEECLCRVSSLYFTLDTDENWKRFYTPHRKKHNPIHNDDILYTKDIIVFKTDTANPVRMAESDWYSCDVITCAAPNLRPRPSNRYNSGDGDRQLLLSDEELKEVHEKRDRRIFDVALQQKVDVLVLGAFGCGAFMNKPSVVAEVMLSLAKEYARSFKVIEFAVYCPPFDDSNYREFVEAAERLGL
ncbi:MAG: TIGR02452 family protein [Treponema sp.]|uniref:TIGR02452 family protein n=1 Tax=Treponema sp. TaxID=166 RepID=UPI0025DF7147|nr:TIGR02452 family protein [Treponema sp.]MBQ9280934.1 TIGR02452 family protein [Treponema sp.]